MSSHSNPLAAGDINVPHSGFAPIGTCHWQGLANLLTTRGLGNADRRMCSSWGTLDAADGILHGGGRWAAILHSLYGASVEIHCPANSGTARTLELELCRRELPFVAEVDAFHLPSPYQNREHVVHTVVVTGRTEETVNIIDTTNNPVVESIPLATYERMRSEPCEGRLDSHKLYVPTAGPVRIPPAQVIASTVRADLATNGAGDLAHLATFISRFADTAEPVNVCRVAAERHQAALLWDLLDEAGVTDASTVAGLLRQLAEDWYLVHMLTTHQRATQPRQRERILRLLVNLADAEQKLLLRATGSPLS